MKRAKRLMISLAQAMIWTTFLSAAPVSADRSAADGARQIILLPPTGTQPSDEEIRRWQRRIADQPAETVYWERLAWAYVAKARSTQDVGFYKLAELTVEEEESSGGSSPETRLLRGHIYHNLHRFIEAERLARGLVAERKSPADYALLSDALMEQGKLDDAVAACQMLTNLRPGVESFSRIAHLRWLYGDRKGAREALESAIRAADPRDRETRAWLQIRLALDELSRGHGLQAVTLSESALLAVPDYPLALAAKGRALYTCGNYETAISFLRRAVELNPIPDNQWWLADALRAQGQTEEATQIEAKLRRFGPATDPRTVSLFLSTRGEDLERATRLATDELQNRSDLYTHDARGFALLRAGKVDEAMGEMALARAHQTDDPRLWFHAGMVAEQTGDHAEANRCYQQAQAMTALLTPSEQTLLRAKLGLSVVAVR